MRLHRMIELLLGTVPIFKGVHIAALATWCGGLLALPLMLAQHDHALAQDDYARIRRATHLTYTICVTPAAVVAVISGTWLIFMREAFVPWFYAKLFFVTLLVAAHAWIGHIMVEVGETGGRDRPPSPYLPIAAVALPVLAILSLVLGKPDPVWAEFPAWLLEPQDGQFPFDVPRR